MHGNEKRAKNASPAFSALFVNLQSNKGISKRSINMVQTLQLNPHKPGLHIRHPYQLCCLKSTLPHKFQMCLYRHRKIIHSIPFHMVLCFFLVLPVPVLASYSSARNAICSITNLPLPKGTVSKQLCRLFICPAHHSPAHHKKYNRICRFLLYDTAQYPSDETIHHGSPARKMQCRH